MEDDETTKIHSHTYKWIKCGDIAISIQPLNRQPFHSRWSIVGHSDIVMGWLWGKKILCTHSLIHSLTLTRRLWRDMDGVKFPFRADILKSGHHHHFGCYFMVHCSRGFVRCGGGCRQWNAKQKGLRSVLFSNWKGLFSESIGIGIQSG